MNVSEIERGETARGTENRQERKREKVREKKSTQRQKYNKKIKKYLVTKELNIIKETF